MTQKKIIIFDMDGTLTESGSRLVFVLTQPKNHKAFHKASIYDDHIPQTKFIINLLSGCDDVLIFIVTARGEEMRQDTIAWLTHHNITWHKLYMKPAGSTTSDDEVKRQILKQIRKEEGEPFMVFDDRNNVNEMWVSEGVFLFDVSQKEYR